MKMENYNEKSKENISIICSLVNQSIGKTKFNKIIWLQEINLQVIHIFNIINKSFINGDKSDATTEQLSRKQVTENCLLYGDQILTCLKQFKNMFTYERKYNISLKSSTQFLAERLLLCLEKINSLNALSTKNSRNIDKLLDSLNSVFEFMNLLQNRNRDDVSSEMNKFNTTIAELISQSLEFACFLDENEKLIIKNICYKIFNNHKSFINVINTSTEPNKLDVPIVQFQLDLLYNAVLSLEVNLNECFLRLIYATFSYLETKPLQTITNSKIQDEVDAFDLANERLIQIGVYAAYYTSDLKIRSKILSGLVTMESLDAHLIPTIMSDANDFRNLMLKTWESTAKSLQNHIHNIIDTAPFLKGIETILMTFLVMPSKTMCAPHVDNIILMLKIVLNHFDINTIDYGDDEIQQHIHNFKLMVNELKAINECFEKVDRTKIIKRIKIIKSILKKISAAIDLYESYEDEENKESSSILSNNDIRSTTKPIKLDKTFLKKTEDLTFDIEISNILNEFMMLSNEL